MISKIAKIPLTFALFPSFNLSTKEYDVPDKKIAVPERSSDDEDGWNRVQRMFRTDDFGRMSSELNAIYQSVFLGGFVGAVYGGFLGSRKAYFDFMDRNQATAFESHLDAKRKLQDSVTVNFAKNAFRFGWRLALFSVSYTGLTTTIAVYRGKSSMVEYLAAGTATGAMYKFNMGLRGMAAGGLVGGFLGGVAGGVSLLILRSTGMTMEEVRYWQYKWRSTRDDQINDGWKKQIIGTEQSDEMLLKHDEEIGADKLDIKILDPIDNKREILKAVANYDSIKA